MIPGSNLLAMAQRLIAAQSIQYYVCIGRTLNDLGKYISTFAAPLMLSNVSVQPIEKSKYENLGLDLAKTYVALYVHKNTVALQRGEDGSGDEFTYGGHRWKLTSNTNWFPLDGWDGSIAVDIGNG